MLYTVVAVVGVFPEIAEPLEMTPIEAEAFLLILLVAMGHAVAWRFMVENPPDDPATDESGSSTGSHRA